MKHINKKHIVFLQLPIPFATNVEVSANIPLGSAAIILHSRAVGNKTPLHLISQDVASRYGCRALIDHIVSLEPSHLCLTVTVWNVERSLHIAQKVKEQIPHLKVWLGGPEVGEGSVIYQHEGLFEYAVEGEGEEAFQSLLKGDSTSSRTLQNLSSIHCPYISGLVQLESDKVMFAEWGRGCKYRCSFCHYHQGRPGGQIVKANAQVAQCLKWAKENSVKEIYLLDPSFEQRKDLEDFLIFLKGNNNNPTIPLMVELRAESITPKLADMLFAAGVRRVETGLQTLNKSALHKTGRSLEIDKFLAGTQSLTKVGIEVKTDVMLGLPGDDEEGFLRTLHFLKENHLDEKIQLFHTQVLPGTLLRKNSQKLGISYSPFPPYHILETPTWSQEALANATRLAEDTLETSFGLEEEPLMPSIDWQKTECFHLPYPQMNILWSMGFDLTKQSALTKFKREKHDNLGSVFTLVLKIGKDHGLINETKAAVRRLLAENPFSTIFIVLQCAPNIPLDIFDEIEELLQYSPLSQYSKDFYQSMASCENTQRRLFALLDANKRERCSPYWLDDLRSTVEVIWYCQGKDIDDLLALALQPKEMDYLFLDNTKLASDLTSLLFRKLSQQVPSCEQLLFPGLSTHWSFRNFLAEKEDWHW